MSAAAELLAQGFAKLTAELGEPVFFRSQTVQCIVNASSPALSLEVGGFDDKAAFTVEFPIAAVTPPPRTRETITVRGVVCSISKVETPSMHRPAYKLSVEE